MGQKQKLIKKKEKFQWTEEMVEYLLDSLKRYKVMCDFSEKDFDAGKTVRHSKLRKEIREKQEGFGPIEIPVNPRADLSIQERKEFEGKKNQKISSLTQVTIKFFKGLSKAIVLGTRSGSHKMLYRHLQLMKSIWGGSTNVDPVDLSYESILEDFDSRIKKLCHFFLFHG